MVTQNPPPPHASLAQPETFFEDDDLILEYESEPDFDEEPLQHDPRTGLELVDVPAAHQTLFEDLEGTVMHYFSNVIHINHEGFRFPAVLVGTDEFQYLFHVDSHGINKAVKRCFAIADIDTLYYTETGLVGFVVPTEFDLLLQTSGSEMLQNLAGVIQSIHDYHSSFTGGSHLQIVRVSSADLMASSGRQLLRLAVPPGYKLTVGPLRMRKALEESVIMRTRIMNMERERINELGREKLNARIDAVQTTLAAEVQSCLEEELQGFRSVLESPPQQERASDRSSRQKIEKQKRRS